MLKLLVVLHLFAFTARAGNCELNICRCIANGIGPDKSAFLWNAGWRAEVEAIVRAAPAKVDFFVSEVNGAKIFNPEHHELRRDFLSTLHQTYKKKVEAFPKDRIAQLETEVKELSEKLDRDWKMALELNLKVQLLARDTPVGKILDLRYSIAAPAGTVFRDPRPPIEVQREERKALLKNPENAKSYSEYLTTKGDADRALKRSFSWREQKFVKSKELDQLRKTHGSLTRLDIVIANHPPKAGESLLEYLGRIQELPGDESPLIKAVAKAGGAALLLAEIQIAYPTEYREYQLILEP